MRNHSFVAHFPTYEVIVRSPKNVMQHYDTYNHYHTHIEANIPSPLLFTFRSQNKNYNTYKSTREMRTNQRSDKSSCFLSIITNSLHTVSYSTSTFQTFCTITSFYASMACDTVITPPHLSSPSFIDTHTIHMTKKQRFLAVFG